MAWSTIIIAESDGCYFLIRSLSSRALPDVLETARMGFGPLQVGSLRSSY